MYSDQHMILAYRNYFRKVSIPVSLMTHAGKRQHFINVYVESDIYEICGKISGITDTMNDRKKYVLVDGRSVTHDREIILKSVTVYCAKNNKTTSRITMTTY